MRTLKENVEVMYCALLSAVESYGGQFSDALVAAQNARAVLEESQAPIPMLLTCPSCGARHVDVGAFTTKPHHTHACQFCGMTWRPAIVATVGVQFLPGFKNEPSPSTNASDTIVQLGGPLYFGDTVIFPMGARVTNREILDRLAEYEKSPGLKIPMMGNESPVLADLVLGLEDALTVLDQREASAGYLIDALVHNEIRHAGDPSTPIVYQRLRRAITAYAPQARGETPATQILTKLLREHEGKPVQYGEKRKQIKGRLGSGNALVWWIETA